MVHGFVYIWWDTVKNWYYVGSHIGTADDGYVCSSVPMMHAYNKRPQAFRRRILESGQYESGSALRDRETLWLQPIDPSETLTGPNRSANSVKYYNTKRLAQGRDDMEKQYVIRFPSGEVQTITNLKQFCKEHSLHLSVMTGIANKRMQNGKRVAYEHRGYRCAHLGSDIDMSNREDNREISKRNWSDETIASKMRAGRMSRPYKGKSYKVINPTGEPVVIQNLSKFCREHNLDSSTMTKMCKPNSKIHQHKGWRWNPTD